MGADAASKDGQEVQIEVDALAFVPGRLLCALVSQTQPGILAVEGKILHITLATHKPWAPKNSNDLLEAMRSADTSGSTDDSESHGERLKVFRDLEVAGETCDAVRLRLASPVTLRGRHFRFFPKQGRGQSGAKEKEEKQEEDKLAEPLSPVLGEVFELLA